MTMFLLFSVLYLPQGTGKTLLARAVAKECSSTFFAVNIADWVQSHVGESEKAIEYLFSLARKSRYNILLF